MHDLVIRNGTIVDGTGSSPTTGDVAIDGATLAAVGTVEGPGRRELDADGAVVAPGWVDIHTHYDGQVSWDPVVAPSSGARHAMPREANAGRSASRQSASSVTTRQFRDETAPSSPSPTSTGARSKMESSRGLVPPRLA